MSPQIICWELLKIERNAPAFLFLCVANADNYALHIGVRNVFYPVLEYAYFMYGKILRELRLERELSQQQLAEILGTTQKTISKYELGYLDLSTEMIITICKYFGVTADYLLGLEED